MNGIIEDQMNDNARLKQKQKNYTNRDEMKIIPQTDICKRVAIRNNIIC